MPALGNHTLIDLYDCDRECTDNVERVRILMLEGAKRAGATIVTESFHKFSPHGVSGVVILAESHLAIHTWPEHRFVAVDLFTCGRKMLAENCIDFLVESFSAGRYAVTTASRGTDQAGEETL
jgi:S-adenosylmethionine decarboxylase proenzyme